MNPHPKQSWRNVEESSTDLQKIIANEDYVKRKNMLEVFDFPEIMEDYLFELEIRNYSLNTIKTYKSIINNFNKFLKNEKELYDERMILRSFKRYIGFLKRKKKVSQNYIYLVTVVLKKFFEFAGIGVLKDVQTPKRTKSLPKSLNEDEVQSLINALDNYHTLESSTPYDEFLKRRNKLILALLYSSGLRVSELVNLRLTDLHYGEGFVIVTGKGNKPRQVGLSPELKKIMLKLNTSNRTEAVNVAHQKNLI